MEKTFPSNWELSAARGAAAVRYMIEKGGIKAIRLIAAGYGDWTPKQSLIINLKIQCTVH